MKHSRAPWGSIWTRFLGFGLGYDLNQEPGESLTHWQSPQCMKNPRGLTLVGLTSVVGYFGIFLALDPTSLWKKIPINCSLGRWRSLQSLAQLLRWCCWKRRRGLVGDIPRTSMNIHERDIVSTASISCPTFFSAANLTVVLCSSSSVFDWKRCTHFGCEGFQYIYFLWTP